MRHLLFVLVVFALCATPAFAAPVPNWDIKAFCAEVAKYAGGSAQIELQCRKDEAAALKAIASTNASARSLKTCAEIGAVAGKSYQIMEQCIKDEMAAEAELAK